MQCFLVKWSRRIRLNNQLIKCCTKVWHFLIFTEQEYKMKKFKDKFKKMVQFIVNPRLILCFGISWIITNGWSYAMFGIGTYYNISWMIAISGGYLTFLWLPISPEKLVTITIAIILLRFLFPDDKKTLGILKEMSAKIKNTIKKKRKK